MPDARKFALKLKRFADVLCEAWKRFSSKISDPELPGKFEKIMDEADALREERNLMLHSIWLATSDPEKPFVRVKEDERDPEIYFDVPTVENLVDRMIEYRNRAYDFFCETFSVYAELPATLYDSKRPGTGRRAGSQPELPERK